MYGEYNTAENPLLSRVMGHGLKPRSIQITLITTMGTHQYPLLLIILFVFDSLTLSVSYGRTGQY